LCGFDRKAVEALTRPGDGLVTLAPNNAQPLPEPNAMPTIIHVGAPSRLVTALAWFVIVIAPLLAVVVPLQGLGWLAAAAAAALAGIALVSAVALLKRLEWGRRVFIGLVLAALAVQLFGLPWQVYALADVLVAKGLAATRLHWVLLLATPAGAVALLWVLKRLRSAEVRQEFA
jgi:hypothetical protein